MKLTNKESYRIVLDLWRKQVAEHGLTDKSEKLREMLKRLQKSTKAILTISVGEG